MNINTAIAITLLCLSVSVSMSLYLLIQHLRYFRCPEYQLYICRIILMVPIYCFTSSLSLIYPELTEYLDMTRDFYEAFVIYSFTMLLMNYVGGERRLSINLELREHIRHPWPLNYFLRSFKPGGLFLRLVKIGVLQFVMVRPLLSLVSIGLKAVGCYQEREFSVKDGYAYIFVLSNFSFTLALYGLIMLYVVTEELLEPFKPLGKFLCIKGVIFFCFWQGVVLEVLEKLGVVEGSGELSAAEVSFMYQNVIVCVEMVIASVAHVYAFSYLEYQNDLESIKPIRGLSNNIKSILSAEDVIKQVKDSISPQEYDFELKD